MTPGGSHRWSPLSAAALALVLLSLAACGADGPLEDVVELPVETDTGSLRNGDMLAEGPLRPDTISGALVLEGERRVALFRLFRSPPGFMPAFSAYVPYDMVAASAVRDTVRFTYARPAPGQRPSMEVVALPAGTDEEEARRRLIAWAGGESAPEERPELLPGAVTSYRISGPDWSGRADLVEHEGRYVMLRLHYPPGLGDGIVPRTDAIRDTWIWSAGGRPLVQGVTPLPGEMAADTARLSTDPDSAGVEPPILEGE